MTKSELLKEWEALYPNFSCEEIDCNCNKCGHELWNEQESEQVPSFFLESMKALQALRDDWGKTMYINSAHRCVSHNKAVGGASRSQHLRIAFDVTIPQKQQQAFAAMARKHGFTGIGFYPNNNFVHIDMRENPAEWEK